MEKVKAAFDKEIDIDSTVVWFSKYKKKWLEGKVVKILNSREKKTAYNATEKSVFSRIIDRTLIQVKPSNSYHVTTFYKPNNLIVFDEKVK